VFEQAALAELLPAARRNGLIADLLGLVRKELIRPEHEQLGSSGDAYRFRHLLIRDAAYEALTKSERAELHARFASWLERVSGDRIEEVEEIIGYHLEQAHHYHVELGMLGPATADLADRAASRLAAAGRRATFRSGAATAINLLERALALRPEPSAERAELLVRLSSPKNMTGRSDEARAHAAEALAWATAAGDTVSRAMAEVAVVRVAADFRSTSIPDMQRAAATLADAGRHRDACYAHYVLMEIHINSGRYAEAIPPAEGMVAQAQLSGDPELFAGAEAHRAKVWTFGPTPVQPFLKNLEHLLTKLAGSKDAQRALQYCLAELYGLIGRFAEARAAALASRSADLEIGSPLDAATVSMVSGPMERLAGNARAAEDQLRTDLQTLTNADERWTLPTTAGLLAHLLCDRGAIDEAIRLLDEAESIAASDDYLSEVLLRSARARALAHLDPARALSLAQDAVVAAAKTDDLVRHGMVLLSLADVHEAAGRPDPGREAIRQARALFEAKGATAYVQLADRRMQGNATREG
jgi:predicted ATPase